MTQGAPLPTYFLSHGGGPWPWMKPGMGEMMEELEKSLQAVGAAHSDPKPSAIVIISAHFEDNVFAISSSPNPPMLYDYGGFPPHTYRIKYSAPGSPELASRIKQLLEGAGLPARLDSRRGYDHGTFVPLYVMYPEADVPIVQLSIRSDYDPATHFKMGQALAPLRNENILIVGSGLTYHNLPLLFNPGAKEMVGNTSTEFDNWLQETLKLDPTERYNRLLQWRKAPSAKVAHPPGGEDHFIPLFVALGAAFSDPSKTVYYERKGAFGATTSSFRFG